MILRDYQKEAVDKAVGSIALEGNDILVMATGAGKSIVIAEIAARLDKEILILQPNREILEQNLSKLQQFVPIYDIGIFSASMGRRSIRKFNFATIGSIYTRADRFAHIGLIIIDEAHLHNIKNTSGMYSSFFKDVNKIRDKEGLPPIKVIGLTATPYRNMDSYHTTADGEMTRLVSLKLINRVKPEFWKRILCNVSIGDLIARGYLCPLEYESRTFLTHDQMELNKSQSDFNLDAFDKKLGTQQKQIVQSIIECQQKYGSILVFCANVQQARRFAQLVPLSESVDAKTPAGIRDRIIRDFKRGQIQTVFNVGVLTTGFDHPELDCIVLLRPTRSLLLYVQMLGRGVRIAKGKSHCHVIDWTNTVEQMGPVENIELRREQFPEFQYPMWELFANGQRWHGKALYSFAVKQQGWKDRVAQRKSFGRW